MKANIIAASKKFITQRPCHVPRISVWVCPAVVCEWAEALLSWFDCSPATFLAIAPHISHVMFLWSWIEFQHTYCELHPNHLYKSNPILKATQLLFFFFLFFFIFTFTLSCFFFSSSYSLEPSSRKEDDKSCNLYFLSRLKMIRRLERYTKAYIFFYGVCVCPVLWNLKGFVFRDDNWVRRLSVLLSPSAATNQPPRHHNPRFHSGSTSRPHRRTKPRFVG